VKLDWIHVYAAIFILAAALSLVLTPACQKLAFATKFLDVPKGQQHKLHAKATPLLGGLAIYLAWIATVGTGFIASKAMDIQSVNYIVAKSLGGMQAVEREFLVICLCATAALILGLCDDRLALRANIKLFVQIAIAAVAATWGGVHISLFIHNEIITWLASVFWILVIFSAINFFDNMDGLAVGTATIAFGFFTMAAAANQQYFVATLGASCAGASLGFWFFNHSPASIFMGDAGSHFVGFMLAVISAKVTYYTPGVSTTHLTVLIPLFILAVPLFDTAAVVAIRIYNRKPIYVGDHNHISHRFLHMGMSRKQAVLLVHLTALVSGLGVLPLLWSDEKTCAVLIVQGLIFVVLISLLQYIAGGRPEVKAAPPAPEEAPAPKDQGQNDGK